MTLVNLGVIGAAMLTGAALGAIAGHKVGCYTTWRIVTYKLSRGVGR